MKKIIFSFIFIFVTQLSIAIPPKPGVVVIRNGDGTYINARIFGDDFFHYALTEDGYLISVASEGPNKGLYVYAYTNDKGEICPTDERVGAPLTKGSKRQAGMPQSAWDLAQKRIEKIKSTQPKGWLTENGTDGERGQSAITALKGLVLLVDFPDLPFTYTNADYNAMLNQKGYSQNGAIGSAADYFNDNAHGKTTFQFDVYGPIRVSKSYIYYGKNNIYGWDENPDVLCMEAVKIAVQKHCLNVSQYDQDNDGKIDMVFFFFAGYGTSQGASSDHIWPHKSSVVGPKAGESDFIDGKRIRTYACAAELQNYYGSEMDGIGTFCHEFSHVLGLADIYDTNGGTHGSCVGMGTYSIMDTGSYNHNSTAPPYYMAFERITVGWMDEKDVLEDKDSYKLCQLKNIEDNDAVVINSKTPNMKYFFEVRDKSKWNAGIPNSGVLAYMIDKSDKKVANTGSTARQLWSWNMPNASSDAPCAMIINANNNSHSMSSSIKQSGWIYPYGSNNSITPTSKPNSISRYDNNDFFYANDIKYNSNDGTGSFLLGEPKVNLNLAFPFISIKVPQGGFKASSTLELIDTEGIVDSVIWYINGVESKTLVSGSNNEIKAKVKLKDKSTQTLYKVYSL